MSFFKRLFGGGKESAATKSQPMRGTEPLQSAEQIDATRSHMEEQMQSDRAKREAQAEAAEAKKAEDAK